MQKAYLPPARMLSPPTSTMYVLRCGGGGRGLPFRTRLSLNTNIYYTWAEWYYFPKLNTQDRTFRLVLLSYTSSGPANINAVYNAAAPFRYLFPLFPQNFAPAFGACLNFPEQTFAARATIWNHDWLDGDFGHNFAIVFHWIILISRQLFTQHSGYRFQL